MPVETERKFLIKDESWRDCIIESVSIRQGYLSLEPDRTVRVRIFGERAFLTVKGLTIGISRLEYEYEIPVADAGEMLDVLCVRPLLQKMRHTLEFDGRIWSVDEFCGENEGLILAEFEYAEPAQILGVLPEWAGTEVSGDKRYYNSFLSQNPYKYW